MSRKKQAVIVYDTRALNAPTPEQMRVEREQRLRDIEQSQAAMRAQVDTQNAARSMEREARKATSAERGPGRPPLQRTPEQAALLADYRAAQAAAQIAKQSAAKAAQAVLDAKLLADAARSAARQARQACIDAGIPAYKL